MTQYKQQADMKQQAEFLQIESYFNAFQSAASKRLNHYIIQTLHEDQSDAVLLHIVLII